MNTTLTCCPSRPAHPSRRSFFKAAAVLGLIAVGLGDSLIPQAKADYFNPSGSTTGSGVMQFGGSMSSAINDGVINRSSYGISNFSAASITTVTNTGTISVSSYGISNFDSSNMDTVTNSGTVNASGGYALANFTAATIGSLVNSGTISTAGSYAFGNFGGSTINTLNNSGTIRANFCAFYNADSNVGTFTNSGTLSGSSYALLNSGTINTLNLMDGSVIVGSISNNGTIGALNIFKTLANGDFNSSSIAFGVAGNQPGVTNRYATVNNGTTVGTFTNSVSVNTLTNAGTISTLNNTSTIATLTNRETIGTITNSGTIGSFTGENGATVTAFVNDGTLSNASGNGISLYTGHITTLTNNGSIIGDWVILLNLGSSITTLNNYGDITGATDGINNQGWAGNVNTITTLNNTGTISGASRFGVCSYGVITTLINSGTISGQYCGIINGGTITTLTNSGTITGNLGEAISNQGTIGTLNLLANSVLNGQISNYGGTIGTLNLYKDVASGDFDSSSIDVAIYGNQPGVTNRYATVNSGTTVGTFTNSVAVNTLDNAGTITTLSNASTITTLTNSGAIGTLTLLSGSSITNSIQNSGSIGTLNLYKTIASGDFNTSSIVSAITGNQPGTINRYASINTGSTVGTLTNAISLRGLTNAGTTAAVNNTGTITLLTNSGTITTLTNSGTIGSVANSGTIGTLNLLGGSTVTSGIHNTGTINVLNLTVTGVTCSNYDLVVPGITGNQPLTVNFLGLPTDDHSVSVTNNGRRASVDVSGFGANNDAIRHVSNSVAHLANTNGVIQAIGAKAAKHAAEPYTLTTDLCADGAPAPADQIGNSDLWIRGFMGRNKVDASASSVDYINTYSGGAVGYERDWSDDLRAGAFLGAGKMKNSLGSSLGSTDSNLLFAGAFATKTWGTSFAKVGLTGGRGNNTSKRNIAGTTPETATADYHSWYVSPEVNVGKVYLLGQHLGGDISVTPVASVRYVYANQGGYTETGATNNLTMNSSHSTTFEERVELKLSYETKAFTGYDVKLNASVGGIGQQNNGGAMSGTLLGSPLSFATPGQSNTTGFVGGLGFEVNRGRYTFTASGDYVRLSGGNADLSANVVLHMKF